MCSRTTRLPPFSTTITTCFNNTKRARWQSILKRLGRTGTASQMKLMDLPLSLRVWDPKDLRTRCQSSGEKTKPCCYLGVSSVTAPKSTCLLRTTKTKTGKKLLPLSQVAQASSVKSDGCSFKILAVGNRVGPRKKLKCSSK